jgi:hypothetical protein
VLFVISSVYWKCCFVLKGMLPGAKIDAPLIFLFLFCHRLNQDCIFESHTVRTLNITGKQHLHMLSVCFISTVINCNVFCKILCLYRWAVLTS